MRLKLELKPLKIFFLSYHIFGCLDDYGLRCSFYKQKNKDSLVHSHHPNQDWEKCGMLKFAEPNISNLAKYVT